jgi:hypothetical protein
MTPRVTVVVLNWCDEEVSRACLASLENVPFPGLQVLLVDNGSHDGSGERLREAFPEAHFLQTGWNQGYAGGNNRGIEWALAQGADYVLVLNNDTEVAPDCVEHLVAAAEAAGPDLAAVVPKILYHDRPDRIWYAGGRFSALRGLGLHWREGEPDTESVGVGGPTEITFMTGCCCLLSARALRVVGGFQEELFAYVEDAELSLRFLDAGYHMLYVPQARVLHHSPPPGADPSPFQIRQRDRNRRWVMRRHFPPVRRIPFLARFYATRAALLARYLLRSDRDRARAIVEGAFGRAGDVTPPPLP